MAEGYHFIAQNTSIHGVEVDLLVKKDILYMVEVKAIRSFAETHFRVTKKQINRLLYARQILQDRDGELTELLIAFVCGKEVVLLRINELLGL